MYASPLRYPGGKRKLANYVKSILRRNNLCDGHYVEPYAGGSAVALELLLLEFVSHIHINDIDPAIYAFWKAVLDQTDELCKMISSTRVSMAGWHRQKEILKNPEGHTKLEIGFATFFVNRTSRSGILNGGVIGGLGQKGIWKINVRYNKQDLIKRIERIAHRRDSISLYRQDAVKFIEKLAPELPSQSLIYLDPPYYVKGKELYRNYYKHSDHVEIESMLAKLEKTRWMATYDDVPEIRKIYQAYDQKNYSLTYTAQRKMEAQELIIYGPGLSYDENEIPYRPKRRAA